MNSDTVVGNFFRFDGLVMRFEAPDSKNRWDNPTFVVHPADPLPTEQIHEALFLRAPPPPNLSTLPVSFFQPLHLTTSKVNSFTLTEGSEIKLNMNIAVLLIYFALGSFGHELDYSRISAVIDKAHGSLTA